MSGCGQHHAAQSHNAALLLPACFTLQQGSDSRPTKSFPVAKCRSAETGRESPEGGLWVPDVGRFRCITHSHLINPYHRLLLLLRLLSAPRNRLERRQLLPHAATRVSTQHSAHNSTHHCLHTRHRLERDNCQTVVNIAPARLPKAPWRIQVRRNKSPWRAAALRLIVSFIAVALGYQLLLRPYGTQ